MNLEIKDFVGIAENAFSDDYCDALIEHFEYVDGMGLTHTRQESQDVASATIADRTYFPNEENSHSIKLINKNLGSHFSSTIYPIIHEYMETYGVLMQSKWRFQAIRLQKTPIGQGYHVWHNEASQMKFMSRFITVIVYLNDVEEGGETEFLYLHKRYKPKKGTVVIFPAGYTHTHRGNPPLSNEKYILTTWGEYIDD